MISDFFTEQDLSFEQVKALTAGMFSVARVDGVHDREMAMIREFYEGSSRSGDPRLEDVVAEFDLDRAVELFATQDAAKLFVKTLILLAFADGHYAKQEDELIREYARKFGLGARDVDKLHEATKDALLSSLSHIQNNEALAQVARRLDVER